MNIEAAQPDVTTTAVNAIIMSHITPSRVQYTYGVVTSGSR